MLRALILAAVALVQSCDDGEVDLNVFVCCASVKDRDKVPGDGRSDPYCRVSAGLHEKTTSTKNDDDHPNWNEDLHMGCVSMQSTIAVHCFDKDKYDSDDSLLDEHIRGFDNATNGDTFHLSSGSQWVDVALSWATAAPTTAAPTAAPTLTFRPTPRPTTAAPSAAPSTSRAPTTATPSARPSSAPTPVPSSRPTTAEPTAAPHAKKKKKTDAERASAGIVVALAFLAVAVLAAGGFDAKALYDTRRQGVHHAIEGVELATVEAVRDNPFDDGGYEIAIPVKREFV